MKKQFALILLTIFVYSCGDNGNNPSIDTSVLMPLKIGNSWTYTNDMYWDSIPTTINYTINVDSEIEYKGVKYFQLKAISLQTNDTIVIEEYYKNKSDGLYLLRVYDDADVFTSFNYPTKKGKVFRNYNEHKFFVEETESKVKTPVGEFTCIKYVNIRYYEEKEIERLNEYYCPGIGLICQEFYITNDEFGTNLFAKTLLTNYALQDK